MTLSSFILNMILFIRINLFLFIYLFILGAGGYDNAFLIIDQDFDSNKI
jgi:hypothetical protein